MNKFLIKYFQRRTSSGKFIQEIDGLRFFAIAPVIIYHLAERVQRNMHARGIHSPDDEYFYLLPSGKLGVHIFFVISGFVIAMPLIKKWVDDVEVNFNFKKYFIRRLTRLEPPYLVVLVLGFFALLLLYNSLGSLKMGTESSASSEISLFESFLASFVYLHGLVFTSYPRINPPAWSLEIEFQFYILAPFFLLGIFWFLRKASLKKWFIPITLLSMLLFKALIYIVVLRKYQMFLVTNYIQYFILGFIICYLYLNKTLEKEFFKKSASLFFIIGFVVFVISDYYLKPYGMNLLFYSSSEYLYIMCLENVKYLGMFLFFAGVMSGGIGRKISQITLISTIGGMCYSIYLIHLFILQVGVTSFMHVFDSPTDSFLGNMLVLGIILVPLTLASSALFFVLIEKPCMDPNWPKRISMFLNRKKSLE